MFYWLDSFTHTTGIERFAECLKHSAVTPGFRRQTECEPCTCQD
jgi:hypothetical protein